MPKSLAGLAVLAWLSVSCSTPQHGAEAAGGHVGGHDWRAEPQHFSVLIASTVEDEETAPSLGLDYEYRVSEFLGVGGVLEYAFEDIDAVTLLAVADLHITPQFIVQTGPGIEWLDDEEEFVFRIGVLYEWESGGYTVSPQLHYDATSGEDAVVMGVAFGFGF